MKRGEIDRRVTLAIGELLRADEYLFAQKVNWVIYGVRASVFAFSTLSGLASHGSAFFTFSTPRVQVKSEALTLT